MFSVFFQFLGFGAESSGKEGRRAATQAGQRGIGEDGDDAVADMLERDELVRQVEARDLIEFGGICY